MRILAVTILMFLGLSPPSLYAGGTEGATPFNFLFLDADARPAAMGGAYAAAARDANALLYNPAGLAGLKEHHFTFQHTAHFQDVTQEYGALALKNGFGFMVNTLSFGKIQRTTICGGWEYVAFKMLALRAGYNGRNETDSGITAGGGIQFNNLSIDYAFVPYGDLGNAHRFSVSARF